MVGRIKFDEKKKTITLQKKSKTVTKQVSKTMIANDDLNDILNFLEDVNSKVEKAFLRKDKNIHLVSACLDCRKVRYDIYLDKCSNKNHLVLHTEKWEGLGDISVAIRFIKWFLKQLQ